MRADRLVSLALLLQARGRMSAQDLAAELEVSVRTVYRDLCALNAAGIPVLTEPGRGGGCRLVDGYRFPLRGLSPDEAEALLILGVPAAVADLGLADTLSAAHRKVSTSAGAPLGGPCLVHLDMPRWFHGVEPVPHLRALAEAVRLGHGLLLGYRRDTGTSAAGAPDKTREVEPLGLVNKAGTWYLVAARHVTPGQGTPGAVTAREQPRLGGDPAVFRVGRVTAARALPSVAVTRPAGFDLTAFWERWSAAFMTSRSQVLVRVRATATAMAVFPLVFGEAGRKAAEAAGPADREGLREVTLSCEEEVVAAHRLAGFGGEVEVIEPRAVRDGLIATARGLLARYESPADAGFAR